MPASAATWWTSPTQLKRAPTYARDETPWASNPDYGREVYGHYGLPYGGNV